MKLAAATRLLLYSGLAVLAVSCRSPQKRVQEQMSSLHALWQTNVAHQSNLPERTVDWPTALAELRRNNLRLRQARIDITNSQEAVRQIFRDLTPTLNLRAGVTKTLKNIPDTTIDDVTLSADSFFNIPGLVTFGARLYATRLFLLRARTAAALTEREQTIELYRLFLAGQETQEHARRLATQKTTALAIREVEPITGQVMFTETELREISTQREIETLQQRAGEVLGNRDYRWVFVTNGLPELRYDLDPMPLEDTNRVAQLQMKLVAIELEAARAQLNGIKLRYWPELNLFISGPPVYQRAFGRERFWDAGDVRASADLFWYIDTRGYISRQLRQTKRQQALQRERIKLENILLIDRLLHTRRLLQGLQEQAQHVERNLTVLEAVPPAQNYAALLQYAEDYRALVEQQRQLRRELAELQTLFWFVDEAAWNQTHDPKPLAAARP